MSPLTAQPREEAATPVFRWGYGLLEAVRFGGRCYGPLVALCDRTIIDSICTGGSGNSRVYDVCVSRVRSNAKVAALRSTRQSVQKV